MRLQKLLWRQMQLRMVRRLQCIFSRVLKPAGIKVTRLARGPAVGSDIEYADEVTTASNRK